MRFASRSADRRPFNFALQMGKSIKEIDTCANALSVYIVAKVREGF